LQQSAYTFATKQVGKTHQFVPHLQAIGASEANAGIFKQDIGIKLVIPRDQRLDLLENLYRFNITRFSLFQSEEALARTLSFKEIELSEYTSQKMRVVLAENSATESAQIQSVPK
jgi:hypothetical protein